MSEQLTQREINWIEGWIDALDADTYAAEILRKLVAAARGARDAEQRAEQAEGKVEQIRTNVNNQVLTIRKYREQRDEARQEAARLREALELIRRDTSDYAGAGEIAEQALQSVPRASELDTVLIWSGEHNAYWRPRSAGYTYNPAEAGHYSREEGELVQSRCGPEKKIELHPATDPAPADRPETSPCQFCYGKGYRLQPNRSRHECVACEGTGLSNPSEADRPNTDCATCGNPVSEHTPNSRGLACPDRPEPSEAERRIDEAVSAVEGMGADLRLTQSTGLLWEARQKVADFRNGVPAKDDPADHTEVGELLPDCMMPDGADPCEGYKALQRRLSQPAPAVPRVVWKMLDAMQNQSESAREEGSPQEAEALKYWSGRIRRALATHPADGDSPAVPDGYVLVPKEPTDEMIDAGMDAECPPGCSGASEETVFTYRAMIAAAPTPTDGGGHHDDD